MTELLTRRPPGRPALAAFAIGLVAALASQPADAARRRPAEGTEMIITGTVADAVGAPVAGLAVELTASRKAFSLRDFRIRQRGSRSLRAETDASGRFELRWLWHPYYNRFDLAVGVDVGLAGGKTALRVLERRDLTRQMRQGSPLVATFTLTDTEFVTAMRQLLASIDSEDERRVYREMGKPDKVRNERRSGRLETSWWYFAAGRVFRFTDDRLDSVDEFEPIAPLPD